MTCPLVTALVPDVSGGYHILHRSSSYISSSTWHLQLFLGVRQGSCVFKGVYWKWWHRFNSSGFAV